MQEGRTERGRTVTVCPLSTSPGGGLSSRVRDRQEPPSPPGCSPRLVEISCDVDFGDRSRCFAQVKPFASPNRLYPSKSWSLRFHWEHSAGLIYSNSDLKGYPPRPVSPKTKSLHSKNSRKQRRLPRTGRALAAPDTVRTLP